MEDLYDPEEKIVCPYNNAHHIRRCKMSFHLVKCRKNYGEQKMVPCDFNVTHMIAEPEIQYHHQLCSDRKKIEQKIVETSTSKSMDRFPMPKQQVAAEENWDDIDVPSYDPTKYIEKNDIIRHLDVASGAQRKNFRIGERHRHSALDQQVKSEPNMPERAQTVAVTLPTHDREITSNRTFATEDKMRTMGMQDKLKLGAKKVFLKPTSN